MAQTIGANMNSLAAQLHSAVARSQWSVSMARLSSGLRVSSAKDAAAGLAIAERFTAQNFQVGANTRQTIAANAIVDARANSLGSNARVAQGYANFTTMRGASVISTGTGVGAEADLALTTSAGTVSNIGYVAYSGADQVAPAINNAAAGIVANSASRSRSQMQTSRPRPQTSRAPRCCSKPPRRWWPRPTKCRSWCCRCSRADTMMSRKAAAGSSFGQVFERNCQPGSNGQDRTPQQMHRCRRPSTPTSRP